MKNYIYLAVMLIPSVIVLCVITTILAFLMLGTALIYLFYLPTMILDRLKAYDLEQEKKKLFPEQFKKGE